MNKDENNKDALFETYFAGVMKDELRGTESEVLAIKSLLYRSFMAGRRSAAIVCRDELQVLVRWLDNLERDEPR